MSAVRHGSAIPRHARPLRKTPQHTADACRDRSSTPHLALPRRRSLHPLTYGERVCPGQLPLGRCQCGISYKLLSEGHGCLSRVEAKLLGHPPRERDIQVIDDRHNVIRDTDRLIGHVRILRTNPWNHKLQGPSRGKPLPVRIALSANWFHPYPGADGVLAALPD